MLRIFEWRTINSVHVNTCIVIPRTRVTCPCCNLFFSCCCCWKHVSSRQRHIAILLFILPFLSSPYSLSLSDSFACLPRLNICVSETPHINIVHLSSSHWLARLVLHTLHTLSASNQMKTKQNQNSERNLKYFSEINFVRWFWSNRHAIDINRFGKLSRTFCMWKIPRKLHRNGNR